MINRVPQLPQKLASIVPPLFRSGYPLLSCFIRFDRLFLRRFAVLLPNFLFVSSDVRFLRQVL